MNWKKRKKYRELNRKHRFDKPISYKHFVWLKCHRYSPKAMVDYLQKHFPENVYIVAANQTNPKDFKIGVIRTKAFTPIINPQMLAYAMGIDIAHNPDVTVSYPYYTPTEKDDSNVVP